MEVAVHLIVLVLGEELQVEADRKQHKAPHMAVASRSRRVFLVVAALQEQVDDVVDDGCVAEVEEAKREDAAKDYAKQVVIEA